MNQPAQQIATEAAQEITVDELYNTWRNLGNKEVIIDLRSPDHHQTAHVPGSKNIPFATVTERSDELKQYNRIYFHCYGGQGSKAISEKLSEMGFENLYFVGQAGFSDWEEKGYPVN